MSDANDIIPVGIDLGTTFSAVAYLDADGKPVTVRNAEGDLTTPSVVFFDRSHPVVGREAADAGVTEPDRLAQFVKRDVGERAYEKPIRGENLPAEVIQALILKKLKDDAELKLGSVQKAVITVPAFFNEPCRKATMDAGRIAGIEVLDIINEPTAAAIMYGVQQGYLTASGESQQREVVLVFDLGGGTFDITIMEIDGAKYTAIASTGDVYLGGVDWDMRIVDFVAEKFQQQFGIDPRNDASAAQELLQKANQAKHSLTARDEVTIFFNHEGHRLREQLTRAEFEDFTSDLLDRTQLTLNMVLSEAQLTWQDVTRVLLVGGSTRMPAVAEMLHEISGLQIDRSLSPNEAVAHGAAIYAGLVLRSGGKARDGMTVTNVSSHALGVLGTDPETGRRRRGVMIPRNRQLPARRMRQFTTARDNQQSVKVEIVEGGDDSGNNATVIGTCVVRDLPPNLPKLTPVDVTFAYGSNGRLKIFASLPTINKKASLSLNRSAGLSESEIQQWRQRIRDGFGDHAAQTQQQAAPETAAASEAIPAVPVTGAATTGAKPVRKLSVADRVQAPTPVKKAATGTSPPTKKPGPSGKKKKKKGSQPNEKPPASDWRSRSKKLSGD